MSFAMKQQHENGTTNGDGTNSTIINAKNKIDDKEEDTKSCPICLGPMSTSDLLHPIIHPAPKTNNNDCQYNFCASCIQQLITSSKSDYEEASDGNLAVKVKLVCPNCRVDISSTIYDTLDSRKKETSKQYWDVPDCELSAKELQIKHMYSDGSNKSKDDDDEKGTVKEEEDIKVDTTLFAGLEYAMTHEEQLYIYTLLTSAKPELLNMAAQLLSNIAEMSLKGITPSMRSGNSSPNNRPKPSSPNTRTTNQRSTLRTGRSGTAGVQGAPATRHHNRPYNQTTTTSHAEAQKIAKHEYLKKVNPLPARMPKYIYLPMQLLYNVKTDIKRSALTFVDDVHTWSGKNVLDAYSRVAIKRKINREKKEEISVDRTLPVVPRGQAPFSYLEEKLGGVLDDVGEHRVLIANVRGIAARSGLQVGDVVTHVNGETFDGDANDLCNRLHYIWEEENQSGGGGKSGSCGGVVGGDKEGFFSLTVNADYCTAYAIQLRAARMKEGL